jgi:hypothetical protein
MNGFEIVGESARKEPREKLFTVEEANRALPLVRRIVQDVVTQYRELERLAARRRTLPVTRRGAIKALDRRAAEHSERLRELIAELRAIGCAPKDWSQGLVDFRCKYEDREVYLCWRLGEKEVGHWHEVQEGGRLRKAIDNRFRAGAPGLQTVGRIISAE